ncbi:MAG TPA: hypothetical protein DIW24_06055, partial [Bacteroidetes bacterium]|nr:hypothetical protein [Bacteroidota bacterium]
METSTFHRLRELIAVLEGLSEEEAQAFLDKISSEEPKIGGELRMIWEKMCEPELPLDRLIVRPPIVHEWASEQHHTDLTGRIFGHYMLKVWIGEGGMGEVYLAERIDKKELIAAVKVLRLGAPAIRRQFEQEQNILAGLRHPGIAYFLDSGTTHDGISYLVMEYVEGIPITEYCNRFQLTIDERLAYFAEISAIVQYAHKHLVVHRDLKPSNILVTPEGRLKLLDFGIAKLLQPTSNRVKTQLHFLTPEYASPEQLLGETITTSSDVYSLGVLLYELLVQVRPYNFEHKNLGQILDVIQNGTLKLPSAYLETVSEDTTLAVAQSRKTTVASLIRRLQGDLDMIARKALATDPNERYPSAETLMQDIRLFLMNKPIGARKPTFAYKALKFYDRNKRLVISTVLGALVILSGIIAITFQQMENWRQTQRSEELAIFLENILLGQSYEGQQTVQLDSLRARQLIHLGWQKMEDRLRQQPEMQVRILTALSELASSNEFWVTADTLAQHAVRKSGSTKNLPGLFVRTYLQAAFAATNLSKTTLSKKYLAAAWDVLNLVNPMDQKMKARVMTARARNDLLEGEAETANTTLQAALAIVKPFEDHDSYIIRGEIYRQLGHRDAMRDEVGPAINHYKEALMAFQLAYGRQHSTVLQAITDLSRMLNLDQREKDAEYLLREARTSVRASRSELPWIQAIIDVELANSMYAQNRLDEAVLYFVAAEKALTKQYPHPRKSQIHLSVVQRLAGLYAQTGKTEQYQLMLSVASRLAQDLVTNTNRLFQPGHIQRMQACISLSDVLRAKGAYSAAISNLQQCVRLLKPQRSTQHMVSLARIRLRYTGLPTEYVQVRP